MKDKELEWFNSYLFNKKNYLCVDRNISSPEPVYCGVLHCGVLQESILGPLLFIIFINNLSEYVGHASVIMYADHASVIMYADDTVLYVSHESKN